MEGSKIKSGLPHVNYVVEIQTIPLAGDENHAGNYSKIVGDPILELSKILMGWPEKAVPFTVCISPVLEGEEATQAKRLLSIIDTVKREDKWKEN